MLCRKVLSNFRRAINDLHTKTSAGLVRTERNARSGAGGGRSHLCCRRLFSTSSNDGRPKHRNSDLELLKEARERFSPLGGGDVALYKDDGTGVATITLDHRERKNAVSGRMMVQLANIVSDLELWTTGRGVILQSEGDFFCSGGDLSSAANTSSQSDGLLMATLMHDTLTRLHFLPLVSVCVVHGRAIGGGSELATATDFRLFTSSGKMTFVQGIMGVTTGWGGGTRLTRLLGARQALEVLLTAKTIDAEAAVAMGLADGIVAGDGDRHARAVQWLKDRVSFETEVVHAMKRIVASATENDVYGSLKNERELFGPLWGGPVHFKALNKNIKH